MAQTYQRIASTRLTSGSSSIVFDSIPQTYTDLELVISGRSSNAAVYAGFNCRVNSSATGYSYVSLRSNPTYASLSYDGTNTSDTAGVLWIPAASVTAGWFGHARMTFVNYSSASYQKTGSYLDHAGADTNGGYMHAVGAWAWNSTAAITRIEIFNGNFVADSLFQLYGITKA